MNRKIFTAIATVIAAFSIVIMIAIAAPAAQAHGLQAPSRGGTSEEISNHSANATETAELPPEDPARGLIYEGLVPGREGGPCEGLFELRAEEAELEGCTHGPDLAPADVDVRLPRSTEELELAAWHFERWPLPCFFEDDNRVQAIYAYASDRPGGSRFAQVKALIQGYAADIDRVFDESAKETGGRRHVRFVMDSKCEVAVDEVQLSPSGDDSFANTVSELLAKGAAYARSDRTYLVWMDTNSFDAFSDYCGIGEVWPDDRPTQNNGNNGNFWRGLISRIDPQCWGLGSSWGSAEAHELMHNLGGVQLSAPNSTWRWHCTDEYDLMCYEDDGIPDGVVYAPSLVCDQWAGPPPGRCISWVFPSRPMVSKCAASHEKLFDCNHDDYYHTSPPKGSYLDAYWNAANSSFLSPF